MELQMIMNNRYEDMVYTLDLFDGKLSLTDILETSIPLLKELEEAKIRILNREKTTKGTALNNQ